MQSFEIGELNEFAACFNLINLMQASYECERGVRWKMQPQRFANNRLTNCNKLLCDIENGTYKPMAVKSFPIYERGKTRVVKPVTFYDRVAQRCFCDHVLVDSILKMVSVECSAVLPGRGLSYAFDRVRSHLEAAPMSGWVAKFDFSAYFASIDQDILLDMMRWPIRDERLFRFLETVITADSPGLELGSHISQLCAAAYPTKLDSVVSRAPGVVGYHRYMDDGIIICRDRESALAALELSRKISRDLKLTINPKKTYANRIDQPFKFCKMRFLKTSGEVRMRVPKKQTRTACRHARNVKRKAARDDRIDLGPVKASLLGYVNHGDADLSRLVSSIFPIDSKPIGA